MWIDSVEGKLIQASWYLPNLRYDVAFALAFSIDKERMCFVFLPRLYLGVVASTVTRRLL